MPPIKVLFSIGISCFIFFSLFGNTLTVSKDGRGKYSTIQAAINASNAGDSVLILDTATYPEQVTIDSTKNDLILLSNNPTLLSKPKIIWRDTLNVGPRTYAESVIDSMITFHANGALRLINCRNIAIDGLKIDGGGWYVFGYEAVWNGMSALEYGNVGLTIWNSGGVLIKNCDISHAYSGIYLSDYNQGGIYAVANSKDLLLKATPFSHFSLMGNHVIEFNRIHNNSFGMYFEQMYDLGTIIRNNLLFENHHYSDTFALKVKSLTSEGSNEPGGAMIFKDNMLSPLAIYNNTFWHNFLLFVGNYEPGQQHLLFNNIYATPNRYWAADPNFSLAAYMELSSYMPNRMNNCVYSFQQQYPTSALSYYIMNGFPLLQTIPGSIIAGTNSFPPTANIRWLEMDSTKFLSIDPSSPHFLEPNWSDSLVKQYILNQGWQKSGVKNSDGSWADLGAISSSGTYSQDLTVIRPILPVSISSSGVTATLNFDIMQRIGKIQNPTIKLFRFVSNLNYGAGSWSGTSDKVIAATNINDISISATQLQAGSNNLTVPVPIQTTPYGFFETTIEGTGSDGKLYTSLGFLPYRQLNQQFDIEIWNLAKTRQLDTILLGDTISVHIKAIASDTTTYNFPIDSVNVWLQSGYNLLTPGNPNIPFSLSDGITGFVDKEAIFTKASGSNADYIMVSGQAMNVVFLGSSKGVYIISQNPTKTILNNFSAIQGFNTGTISFYDLKGRKVLSHPFNALNFDNQNKFYSRQETGLASNIYLMQISFRDNITSKTITKVQKILIR
jgi:hypothetical protein